MLGLKVSTVLQNIVHSYKKKKKKGNLPIQEMPQSLTLRHMAAVVQHLICVTRPGFEKTFLPIKRSFGSYS